MLIVTHRQSTMSRIRKRSNYVKNKPSDLPVYLTDTYEEVDVTTIDNTVREEHKPEFIEMDGMQFVDELQYSVQDQLMQEDPYQDPQTFQEFQNQQDFQDYEEELNYFDNPEDDDLGSPQETSEELSAEDREKERKKALAARARARYNRMTEEERKKHNQRRRLRQLGLNPDVATATDLAEAKQNLSDYYKKKAEVQRQRYHALSDEQKRAHNKKRSEASKRRRQMENEILYSTNGGETGTSEEQVELARHIVTKSAQKAEAARLRYQRMTPEERKELNKRKAAAAKRRRLEAMGYPGVNSQVQAYPHIPSGYIDLDEPRASGFNPNSHRQAFEGSDDGQGTSQNVEIGQGDFDEEVPYPDDWSLIIDNLFFSETNLFFFPMISFFLQLIF